MSGVPFFESSFATASTAKAFASCCDCFGDPPSAVTATMLLVATGATDEKIDAWVRENATQKDRAAIIKWNNEMRCLRLSELSPEVQEYFETYIPQFCHPPSKVKFFFDVYDVEEGVL